MATAIEWTDETWNPVPGWPGFLVTADGRVRGPSGGELTPRSTPTGHLYVTSRIGGRGQPNRKLYVHRAVLLAFIGPCPPGQEARHFDGDPSRNHVSNLAWGTREEQRDDDRRHGVSRARPKLSDADRALIREQYGRRPLRAIARDLGVSHTTVRKAALGV